MIDALVVWLRVQFDDIQAEAQTAADTTTDDFRVNDLGRLLVSEIKAKRQILDEHGIVFRTVCWYEADSDGRYDTSGRLPVCRTCVPKYEYFASREAVPTGPCVTVKLLALPYSDRPGYRAAWRPCGAECVSDEVSRVQTTEGPEDCPGCSPSLRPACRATSEGCVYERREV